MRVLVVIDSLEQGGAERSLVDLAPHLVGAGVALDILTVRAPGFLAPAAAAAGATVHGLGVASRRAAVEGIRTAIRGDRPDLVHTTLYEANVAGRVAATLERVPVVSSLVSTPYGPEHLRGEGLSAAKVRAAQAVDAATARVVRRFHATSHDVAAVMRRRLVLGSVPIDVVPRGRDPEVLGGPSPARRARARQGLGVHDHHVVVLAIARHEVAKGLDVLVDAVALLPPGLADRALVLVAGRSGRASAALAAQVAARGLESTVRFLGVRDDVADLLAAADVAVVPSRREGFPGVLVEAMAMEVPVVVTAAPGSLEALGRATGVVVPVDDARALAEGISSVLAHPAAAAERAAAGRRRVLERFTTAAVAGEMRMFYERALGPGGGPRR